jgi:hypothetical protein
MGNSLALANALLDFKDALMTPVLIALGLSVTAFTLAVFLLFSRKETQAHGDTGSDVRKDA